MNTHRERKDIRDGDDDDDDDDEGILASGRFCRWNDENKKIVLEAVIIMSDREKGVYGSCTYVYDDRSDDDVKMLQRYERKGKRERDRERVCVCVYGRERGSTCAHVFLYR